MISRILVVCCSIWLAATARGGVTIHFEGTAKSAADIPSVLQTATEFAKKRDWEVQDVAAESGKLRGLVIYPHSMSEPVWLQFGEDLVLRDSVKTQFAGAAVHMEIIRLFDALKPALKSLSIQDDGEYWEKRDPVLLENHLNQVRESLRQMKREEPAMYGPIKLKDGRIVDMLR
jgi:hypothetical protein